MSAKKIRLVCATRESGDSFLSKTALGRSLALYTFLPFLEVRLFEKNVAGLPSVYNIAIREARQSPAVLVFIHDDVHLCDFNWAFNLLDGLEQFHVIGLAGNKRRVPRQPSWAFVDDKFTWDSPENLSGIVGHGTAFPCSNISAFGQSMQEVKLLDGLMLACRSDVLLERGLNFDERFNFHHYDLDFCRQAEQKGLRMGTWRISVIHESGGSFGSPAWRDGYQKYLEKWRD
jgi:GT2 family glycosyltransferase